MSRPQNTTWTTKHEMKFLDNLGNHSKNRKDPKKLLRGYLNGAILRVDWNGLNPDKVVRYAKELLSSY